MLLPGTTLEDFPDFKPSEENKYNVVDALDALTRFLKNDTSADDTYYIKTLKEQVIGEENQRSFALRLIIHYVGDIHQPLHNSALVSDDHPRGDAGGNAIAIKNAKSGVNNLHKLYDSVVYKFPGYVTLPLSESSWSLLKSEFTLLTYYNDQ